jgi:hypothetical protein
MSQAVPLEHRRCWCQIPVPSEIGHQNLCMNHFLIEVERDCADLRREIAQGKTLVERQSEISSYVKSTAMKLTDVATSRLRLSDELKKRILTTLLTLMNLHESLDRSANRTTPVREMRPLIVPA